VDVFGTAVAVGGAFLRDAAVAAGHDLGIFEALARGGPASLDDIAEAIGVSAGRRRLRALLDVLAAQGAIARERPDAGFAAETPPRFAAVATAPAHPFVARAGWGLLADVIRNDRPLPVESDDAAVGVRRLHHHLASAGAAAARELVACLGTSSLLDLGAGAGAYSKAFLGEHSAARATLVDTREVLALAGEWLGPLAERARLIEGDAATVDAGDGHGAVLLANLLHLHSPAMCARLCAAAARAVAPGGVVVIKDLRVDDDRAGPLEGLLFALNMAIYTEAGDVYSTSQLRTWLAGAGLVEIVERRLVAAPDAVVVIAHRPGASAASVREAPRDSAESGAGVAASERTGATKQSGIDVSDKEAVSDSAESGRSGPDREPVNDPAESGASVAIAGSAGATACCEAGEGSAAPGDGLSLEDAEEVAVELDAALAQTAGDAWRELVASDAIRPDAAAGAPALAFPLVLRRFLARAVALERSEAGPEAAQRADNLVRHYTGAMPRMRVAQLAGTEEPGATLFHTPLDWDRLPRLGAAIDRLFVVLGDAGVASVAALGAASADAFRARTQTLAALYERTHYGGFMPLLYGFPADLAYMHARGVADGLDVLATIDRYLTAPIVHELCHFAPGRTAFSPPHLDECIAGWLGVHVHPELAYPAGDHDDALYAAPWLAQVGQAIARAFGIVNLVRAHAGGDLAALPRAFVAAAARLGWDDWCARRTLHFLSDTFDPAPWVALALATAGGALPSGATLASFTAFPLATLSLPEDPEFDRSIVEDGLRAMCLASRQVQGSFRTRSRLPDGAITIDVRACAVVAPSQGELDPVVPRYWLPPAVAARVTARGRPGYELHLGSITAIREAAAAICEASPGLVRDDFALVPRAS